MKLGNNSLSDLQDAESHVEQIRDVIRRAGYSRPIAVTIQKQPIVMAEFTSNPLYDALLAISEPLAKSYAQVKLDLDNDQRLSWAGTAHEIRQILSSLLQILAPDEDVEIQSGFQFEKGQNRPTQKQRVTYILRQRGANDRVREVVKEVVKLDEIIENLVRGTYERASDAAHTFKEKEEVKHILRYFEAFMPDLLGY